MVPVSCNDYLRVILHFKVRQGLHYIGNRTKHWSCLYFFVPLRSGNITPFSFDKIFTG